MPLTAEDFPRIQAVTQSLRQGDLISTPYFPMLETPGSTFEPDVEDHPTIAGRGVWAAPVREINSGWGVIVTQTCDIVRDVVDEPYLQVVPLMELASEDAWRAALHGRSGSFFALPAHEQACAFPGIDGQIWFPVPKATLVHPEVRRLQLPFDPAGRIYLSIWMARRFARHPFPDALESLVLRPLRSALVERFKSPNTQVGAFVHSLLGVWSTPEEAPVIDIYFVMSGTALTHRSKALPDHEVIAAQAEIIVRPIAKRLEQQGSGVQLRTSIRTLDGVSAQDLLLNHRQVDLDLLPYDAFVAEDARARALAGEGS